MKNQIINLVILIIIMTSCAFKNNKIASDNPIIEINDSIAAKHEVINDFLDKKIKNHSKIIIMSQKINNNLTLRILRINDIYSLDTITGNYVEDKTFYKEEDWEKARKKYSKNSIAEIEDANSSGGECCWIAENFDYKNVIFEELQFGTPAYEKKYFYGRNSYDDFYFSDPIYYHNKEYLIFSYSYGKNFPTQIYDSGIIIYKKINGKWVETHRGNTNWLS